MRRALRPRIDGEIASHLSYIATRVESREFLVGHSLTGADIQLAFVLEAAERSDLLKNYPALEKYLSGLRARSCLQTRDREGRSLRSGQRQNRAPGD